MRTRAAIDRHPGRGITVIAACALLGAVALAAAESAPAITFADVTQTAGINFTQHNGATGNYWYPELFGGGVAVLDVDGDRWPDLLLVNGKDWQPPASRPAHKLYRNNHDGTFKDIFAGSGLDTVSSYGLGASIADYD